MKNTILKPKSKNNFLNPAVTGKDPCLRRKCPECSSKDYQISVLYGYLREYKNGKLIYKNMRRQDAGSFQCNKCGYTETY